MRQHFSRLLNLFRSSRLDDDMAEEFRLHIEYETERNISKGMDPVEARYAARRAFGGIERIKEEEREARGFIAIDTLNRNLRYAFRQYIKRPGLSIVALLSLAIGIGSTTTVFSWIQSVMLNPFPGVPDQEQIVVLTRMQGDTQTDTINLPNIRDLDGLDSVFEGVIGSQITPASVQIDGDAVWLYGQIATSNFFKVLQVTPMMGSTFAVEPDITPGSQPVLVISETCWRRTFASDPDIIGRTVSVNRHPFTIIGVTPADFAGTMSGLQCDFWAPITMCQEITNEGDLESRWGGWLHTQARLKRDVSIKQAQSSVDVLMDQLRRTYPRENHEVSTRVTSVSKAPYGVQPILIPVLGVLFAVCALVLLIVIANLANLQLAHSVSRRKEIAIRMATGAGRGHVIRQLLTESLLLSLMGSLMGILFAAWATNLLSALLPDTDLPISTMSTMNSGTVLFGLSLALIAGLVFGITPALQAARGNTNKALKESGRSSSVGPTHHRIRSAFVVSQVALALMLTIGAGLCIRGTLAARNADIGIRPEGVLAAGMRIGMNGYDEQAGIHFYNQLHTRLNELPQVTSCAFANWLPLGLEGCRGTGVEVPGYDRKENEDTTTDHAIISPDYFNTLGIPFIDGRDFNANDDTSVPKVAIINQAMAQRFWAGQNALGQIFFLNGEECTVVGIVKTGKYRRLNEPDLPFLYLPYTQGIGTLDLNILAHTDDEELPLIRPVRETVHSLDPSISLRGILPMSKFIEGSLFAQHIALNLLVSLGTVALSLAAIGIFAVMAYSVSQRTQEMGVRIALGAMSRDILGFVLRSSLNLTFIGLALGLIGALLLTRLLGGFLYGVSPFDLIVFSSAVTLVIFVTLLATWLPAHRATRVNPLVALRAE